MHGSPVRHITTRRPGDKPMARNSFPSSSLRFDSAITPVCPDLSAESATAGTRTRFSTVPARSALLAHVHGSLAQPKG